MRPLVTALEAGEEVLTGDRVPASDVLTALGDDAAVAAVLDDVAQRLDVTDDAERASAAELALEGLYLARRIGKDTDEYGRTAYLVERPDDEDDDD